MSDKARSEETLSSEEGAKHDSPGVPGVPGMPDVPGANPFERIKRQSEELGEYWSARDLSKVLGYTDYRNFVRVIRKAELTCQNSGQEVGDRFVDVTDMAEIGSGAKGKVSDV